MDGAPAGPRAPVAPVVGWLALALVVTAAVLLVGGVSAPSVLALVAAGAGVGAVLVVAVRLSPPVGGPDVTRGDGGEP